MKYWKQLQRIKNYLHGIPCINFHIILMHATSYDADQMKSLTLENVLSVANSESES